MHIFFITCNFFHYAQTDCLDTYAKVMEEFLQSEECPDLVLEEVAKAKYKSATFKKSKGNVDLDRQEANDEEIADDEGANDPDGEYYGDDLDPGDPTEKVDDPELNAELQQLYEHRKEDGIINCHNAQVLEEANLPIDFNEDTEMVSALDMKFYLKK